MKSQPNEITMKYINRIKTAARMLAVGVAMAPLAHAEDWPAAKPGAITAWQDMRFGMFIHWGPVSLTGREIGWSRGDQTPIEVYDALYKKFNPVKFNADEWVGVAKAAGMKYIVLTTKHHDGFCLWDTKFTDHNIMNTPFKRDVVKELAAACKKQGIKFGAYYSVCDWHHPDFPLTSPGGTVRRKKSNLDAYQQYLLNQIKELITNYGPLVTIWNDVPQEFSGRGAATIKMVRGLQPDILINDRTGDGGDYSTPEQTIGSFNISRPWESCMTVSAHNAWAWGGSTDGVKDLAACLKFLICAAGGDGNMLLNVGPTPEGEIAPEQANRIKEMGGWLHQYGESIYGTRGGPWKPTSQLVSTRKGDCVYLHVLNFGDGTITLPALPKKTVSASLLTGGKVAMRQSQEGVSFTVAKADQQLIDTIIKLKLYGPAMDIAPISAVAGLLKPGMKTSTSNIYQNDSAYGPDKAIDDDDNTRWATDNGTRQAWLEVDLGKPTRFGRVNIEEPYGRVRSFEILVKQGEGWKPVTKGTKLGDHFTAGFEPVTAQVVRLNILDASDGPTISQFQLLAK